MKSKKKVMLLSVLMAAVFGVCNLGGIARFSLPSAAQEEPAPQAQENQPGEETTEAESPSLAAVAGVTLDLTTLTLSVGESKTITATVTPEDADKTVTWSTSDETVAAVGTDGTVTAKAVGNATITATTSDVKIKATAEVEVVSAGDPAITTAPVATANWTYDGNSHALAIDGAATNGGKFKYSVNNGAFGNAGVIPEAEDAGTYKVAWKLVKSDDTDATGTNVSGDFEVIVAKRLLTITAKPQTIHPGQEIQTGVEWAEISGTVAGHTATLKSITLTKDEANKKIIPSGASLGVTKGSNYTYNSSSYVAGTLTIIDTAVPVTGITVSKPTLTLAPGAKETIIATVAPENATNKKIVWASHNSGVALVSDNGEVTAIANGSAVITATTEDGNYTAVVTVTVSNNAATSTKLTITDGGQAVPAAGITLLKETSKTLGFVSEPAGAVTSVKWMSVTPAVATVDETTGLVTALKAGTTQIIAFYEPNEHNVVESDPVTVTVVDAMAEDLTLTAPSAKVTVGDTLQVTAKVTPESASNAPVTWSSADETIATVNEKGEVKGIKAGEVRISASAGGKTKVATITVVPTGTPVIRTAATLTPSAKKGEAYKLEFTASGVEKEKLRWAIASDTKTTAAVLKDSYGLELAENGTLSGTPKETSTGLQFKVRVWNADTTDLYDEKEFTLVIETSASMAKLKDGPENQVTAVSANNLADYVKNMTETKEGKNVVLEMIVDPMPADSNFTGSAVMLDEVYRHFGGVEKTNLDWRFLDITLNQKIDGGTETKVTTTTTPIEIELTVDTALTQRTPIVVRYHDSKAELFTRLANRPAASEFKDATYYVASGKIYIYSSKYSLYTIAYPKVDVFTVSFSTGVGGTAIPDVVVQTGGKVPAPTDPTREGYSFDGWFRDTAATQEWDMETDTVTADLTLYANWTTGQSSNRAPRSANTEQNTSVRGSQTGDNKEAERIVHILIIMTTSWIVLFNALAFGKKRRQRVRRK